MQSLLWRPSWWKRAYELLPWEIRSKYVEHDTPEAAKAMAAAWDDWRQRKKLQPGASKDRKEYDRARRTSAAKANKVALGAELDAIREELATLPTFPGRDGHQRAPRNLQEVLAQGRRKWLEERQRRAGNAIRAIKLV